MKTVRFTNDTNVVPFLDIVYNPQKQSFVDELTKQKQKDVIRKRVFPLETLKCGHKFKLENDPSQIYRIVKVKSNIYECVKI